MNINKFKKKTIDRSHTHTLTGDVEKKMDSDEGLKYLSPVAVPDNNNLRYVKAFQ